MITIEEVKAILKKFVRRGLMLMLLISPIFLSCIQELGVFTGVEEAFVIDGVITNEFGPHVIKIAKTKQYNTARNYFAEVENAIVIIEDDLGNTIQLTDKRAGIYHTPDNFIGVIGNSYRITVTLNSGIVYQSEYEELFPVPSIDKLTFGLADKEILSDENLIIKERVVSFFVDFKDPANVDNFYKWRYHETFEIFAPKAEELELPNITCWAQDYDREFLKIDRDLLFDGKEMRDFEVFYAEIGKKFAEDYFVKIEQQSLTPKAYSYWETIKNQIDNNGTIFETSNFQIRGNISNLNDNDELVLGYFGASAVTSMSILVHPGDIGFVFFYACEPDPFSGRIPTICLDCTSYSASSTTTKPDYWPL